jgi:hypothetical protein
LVSYAFANGVTTLVRFQGRCPSNTNAIDGVFPYAIVYLQVHPVWLGFYLGCQHSGQDSVVECLRTLRWGWRFLLWSEAYYPGSRRCPRALRCLEGGGFFCGLGCLGVLLTGYDRLLGRRVWLRRPCWQRSSLLCGARRGIACALLAASERREEHHGGDRGEDADTYHLGTILRYSPKCVE